MTNRKAATVRTISLIGGECSGKSTLAEQLVGSIGGVLVVEQLRLFVDTCGRVPRRDEQMPLMEAQIAAEVSARAKAAESGLGWVVSDPAALMTAIYSQVYFNDDGLLAAGLAHQNSYALTVWCDIDLPWLPDGNQRDGPAERHRVHEAIGAVVDDYSLKVLKIQGTAAARLGQVERAIAELNKDATSIGDHM